MVVEKLKKALELRRGLLQDLESSKSDTYRFFAAEADGEPGFAIEVLGPVAVFQFHVGKCTLSRNDLIQAAEWCLGNLRIKHVYLKSFEPDRSSGPTMEKSLEPLAGLPAPESVRALENGKVFLIRPTEIYSVGLFLDQRQNRKALAEACTPASKVLNLFSYTCAFSVYCASAGAETTSVDVSSKYLDWGKENFRENGLDLVRNRFFVADARYFLRAALKRNEAYDLIIVDPPSFARGKQNEPFSVRRDLGQLLVQCREVLASNGTIFASTNYAKWTGNDLERVVKESMGQVKYLPLPAIPSDYGDNAVPIIYRWLQPLR